MRPIAVLFGHDEMLNLTRRWILERTGCVVFTASQPGEVTALCGEHPVELLVLCYTLTKKERDVVSAAAEAQRPGVKRLWLQARGQVDPPPSEDMVLTSDGPHELFQAVRRVVDSLNEAR